MPSPPPPSLGRLAGALIALAVVPALAFAAVQIFVQSESERQLAALRDKQLDGLLFSVNQDAWDLAAVWADRLARAGDAPESVRWFLSATPAVQSVLEADSSGRPASFGEVRLGSALGADRAVLFTPDRTARLLRQQAVGYRKLEPVTLPDGRLALVFVADGPAPGAPPQLMAMVSETDAFLDATVTPKLREVVQGGVALAVFKDDHAWPRDATTPFARDQVHREAPLWFLPRYVVGARLQEGSAETTLRRRLWQSLLLIGGVTAGLGVGAFLVWRGVRREIEVARLREDFVSNVSHELRTPLALIRMYAESLEQGRVPEHRRPAYYATLVAESERLSRLVGNVLQAGRFDRGTATVARERVDLSELAAEMGERYRPVVEEAGGTLALNLRETPAVTGDRDLLREALVNLIDNAVKYGGGDVEVATRARDDSVALEVADRGPGIDAADLHRVFEPFVRLQPESADGLVHTAKGTGLGLALVRRIAPAHGGTASAAPRAGGGTVFRILLPYA